ncbi:phage tail protein [Avibacterium paragallinarum]|uniref:Phage tail protein n=1 Tax=Avibacterium paragallinarum TaxID=728 RepID=A0AAE5TM09_AVIPA|nr:phage tail protein [Avibacterium paragallinarum]MEE3609035.1 phage tail protein [Avibacterium paragallinarum]MEE3621290.1 phage tail protein [Avibacterium paragallinarum]MEE3668552.1 phage tail protein [Avibacterium paragallinarum]MEE3681241.1 phage tail protein [Avibacterium paragallinarum]MEE4386211.1 phage tail protein [Avibacterium paragallinarum]
MKKPNQLRAVLEKSYPDFIANPDRLQLFVDNGRIIATGGDSLSFEYRYTLDIIATDFADDLARLIVPIQAYLKANQPELFENPQRREEAFKFEVDYNNNHTLDVAFKIQLTERVVAKQLKENELNLEYTPEPQYEDTPLLEQGQNITLIIEGKEHNGNH